MNPNFYNAHHSPTGAFSTLTLGQKGATGGLGLELAGPANEPFHIGIEALDGSGYLALPFAIENQPKAEDYDVEGISEFQLPNQVRWFEDSEIDRKMGPSVDTWKAGDLTFSLISPVVSLPDVSTAREDLVRQAILPAVYAEISIDNRQGDRVRRAYFGYAGSERSHGMRLIEGPGWKGIAQHNLTGIATDAEDARAGISFQPEKTLEPDALENLNFLVGNLGLIVCSTPPGEVRTFRFAIGFFIEGTATHGVSTRYYYRKFFESLDSVLSSALTHFDSAVRQARVFDADFGKDLSPERRWMAAHAIRSYFGSTQLLEREDGSPIWVVNEGEYRMMNTLDLTVDQAFFELALNPWTVRNVLDFYAERYSYEDDVRFPGEDQRYPGGLSFTHDMGVGNTFARESYSGYEQAGLRGCFSYMTAEELMNWVLTAGLYEGATQDSTWATTHRSTFVAALGSLMNRDHPEDEQRNGVVGLDAARCQGGAEITTYDSLDTSLGQARNNLYLAVKGWATYLLLARLLAGLDETEAAAKATLQAERAVKTILASANEEGLFPAVIGEGVEARIIPAIEALVYPHLLGIAIDPELQAALKRHLEQVLRPGVCRFADGGWKLSSTSRNSWLSKIYLCQFVAERILGMEPDPEADRAHANWLLAPENSYFAWSDQILAGKAVGSRYYPRGVTSILWLIGSGGNLADIAGALRGVGVPA